MRITVERPGISGTLNCNMEEFAVFFHIFISLLKAIACFVRTHEGRFSVFQIG